VRGVTSIFFIFNFHAKHANTYIKPKVLESTYVPTYLPTPMEQSPWETYNYSATQEIPHLVWNSKVHYHVHNSPPLVPILIQMHPVHTFPPYFRKVKLLLCLTEHHAMKTYGGSGDIAPRILDLGTRRRWVVSFTPRPLYPQRKSPRYPLDTRLGGPPSRSGRGGSILCYLPTYA
jgi:hypothetical protein